MRRRQVEDPRGMGYDACDGIAEDVIFGQMWSFRATARPTGCEARELQRREREDDEHYIS